MKKKKMHMVIPTKDFIILHPFLKKQNAAFLPFSTPFALYRMTILPQKIDTASFRTSIKPEFVNFKRLLAYLSHHTKIQSDIRQIHPARFRQI